LKNEQHMKAINILIKAEKMLEVFKYLLLNKFSANCGKTLDRNIIIVTLYNRACAYQGLWILDKCSKYIDGVIYNLELSINEDQSKMN